MTILLVLGLSVQEIFECTCTAVAIFYLYWKGKVSDVLALVSTGCSAQLGHSIQIILFYSTPTWRIVLK